MQNSFEKQVQDKMDGLRFEPSEPVWQKVEEQIRRKKERRRLVLWLPLLVLLLGLGFWATWNAGHENGLAEKNNIVLKEEGNQTKRATEPSPQSRQEQKGIENDPPVQDNSSESIAANEIRNSASTANTSTGSVEGKMLVKNKKAGVGNKQGARVLSNSVDQTTLISGAGVQVRSAEEEDKREQATGTPQENSQSDPFAKKAPLTTMIETEAEQPIIQRTVKNDKNDKPWKLSVQVSGGFSNLGSVLGSSNLEFADASNPLNNGGSGTGTTGSPLLSAAPPAPYRNSFGFSAGIGLEKKLGDRIGISTGIQYRYYSARQSIGSYYMQDTLLGNGNRVNSFYGNAGGGQKDYQHQFHFLSLPINLNWQMVKNIPLQLEAGFSVQRLLSTTALSFDRRSNVFFSDDAAINKWNFMANFGLHYSFGIGGRQLQLGPEMQYGLRPVQASGSKNKLFYFGLGARYQFTKKK